MSSNDVEFLSSSEDSDYDDIVSMCGFSCRHKARGAISRSQSRYDPTGRDTYTKACNMLNITPARHFIRSITQTEVDLSHRSLGPVGARAISIALLKNVCVTKLNLEDNDIREEGMRCVGAIFEQNYFITDLNVADNNFDVKGAEHVAKILATCNTLKKLDISGNNIENHGIELIAESLSSNYALETLVASNNNITEKGPVHLQKALDGNISLKEVNLAWNKLRCRGATEIAKALESSTSLRSLDISWNGIGDDGALSILDALVDNTSLSTLNLANNRIGDLGGKSITKLIPKNEALEYIDISANPIRKRELLIILQSRMHSASSQLNTIVFRDKNFAVDSEIVDASKHATEILGNFKLCLEHIKVRDDMKVREWKEKHIEDLCERFLAFVRGRRIRMMDIFQRFGARGDLVLTVSMFLNGMGKLKKDLKMSDWEIYDLAQYFRSEEDGQIHYSRLTSI